MEFQNASEGHCVDYGWGCEMESLLQTVTFVICIRTKCDFDLFVQIRESGLHGELHGVARNLEVINVCEYLVMA